MTAIICINIVFMMMVRADASDGYNTMLGWANVACTALFLLEMLLKWTAIGLVPYFKVCVGGGR